MSPTPIRVRRVCTALLALAVVLSPLPAWAGTASETAAKKKHYRTVIRQALQSAVRSERLAVDQLSKAATVDQVRQGAKTAHAGYADMRRAADRLETLIEMNEKYPDPMLKLHDKQLEDARYVTRLGLAEVEGAEKYDAQRIRRAIEHFRRATSLIEIVLASMV